MFVAIRTETGSSLGGAQQIALLRSATEFRKPMLQTCGSHGANVRGGSCAGRLTTVGREWR